MALLYDNEAGLYIDNETGAVYDAEDEQYIGQFEDFYDDAPEDDSDLSPEDVNAIYDVAADEMRDEIEAVNRRISEMETEDALRAGYAMANDDLDQLEEEDQAAQDEWDDSMSALANKLGRPISVAEADRIERWLPDTVDGGYSQADVERAARELHINSFVNSENQDHRNGGARGARSRYMEDRLAEMEQEDREHEASGEPDPTDMGGLFGSLVRDERAERLAQAMSTEGLNRRS